MLRSRLLVMVTSGLLGGCVGVGGLNVFGTGPGDPSGLTQGAPLATDKVAMSGQVLVPTLISNNANALIGNNANALVGNNVAALRILGLASSPLGKMRVAAFSANSADKRVSDIVTTDADGKFTLEVPKGALLFEATLGQVRLLKLAGAQQGGSATLDAASTLAAAQALGSGASLGAISQADVDELARQIAAKLDDKAIEALLGSNADLEAQLARLAAADSTLAALVAKLLGAQSSSSPGNPSTTATPKPAPGGDPGATRTKSVFTAADWGTGASPTPDPQSGLTYLEAQAPKTHVRNHTLRKGDKVRFSLYATDGTPDGKKTSAYLNFVGADEVQTKVGIVLNSGQHANCPDPDGGPATATCVGIANLFQTFQITLDRDIKRLEFGGETSGYTARITSIDINYDL